MFLWLQRKKIFECNLLKILLEALGVDAGIEGSRYYSVSVIGLLVMLSSSRSLVVPRPSGRQATMM